MSWRTALSLLAVIVSAGTGHGQVITIDTNTVYNTEDCHECSPHLLVVDGDAPPTVLDVVVPANLSPVLFVPTPPYWAPTIELRGTSILNMSGGNAFADSTTVLATSQSAVNVTGGRISSSDGDAISAVGQARVNIRGGVVFGGDDGGDAALRLDDDASAEISGGWVFGDMGNPAIRVAGHGRLTITGGRMLSDVLAQGSRVIDIVSGRFELGFNGLTSVKASDESVVNISGGRFFPFGGEPAEGIEEYQVVSNDRGTVNIFGTDFSTEPFLEDWQRLRGRLADGRPINFLTRGNVILHEVPEPSTFLLATFGLGPFLLRHGRSTVVTPGVKA